MIIIKMAIIIIIMTMMMMRKRTEIKTYTSAMNLALVRAETREIKHIAITMTTKKRMMMRITISTG